jgi:hypothetical protein
MQLRVAASALPGRRSVVGVSRDQGQPDACGYSRCVPSLHGAIPIDFGTMFPDGVRGRVFEAVRDFDRSQGDRFVQQQDKGTGLLVWTVDVIDADPKARDCTVHGGAA